MAIEPPNSETIPSSAAFSLTEVTIHALSQVNQINEHFHIPVGQTYLLGSIRDDEAQIKLRDLQISRKHADLTALQDGSVQVVRRPRSLNRVYLLGDDRQFHDQQFASFRVRPGQTFAIGSTFLTVEMPNEPDAQPAVSVSISAGELHEEMLAGPDKLLQAALNLPGRLAQATSEEAMLRESLEVLHTHLPRAALVAIVTLDGGQAQIIRHMGSRQVHVSQRLITDATRSGEAVLYQWQPNATGTQSIVQQPTWGACLRIGYLGYCLYLGGYSSGAQPSPSDWRSVLRFLEFVGSQLGSMLSSRRHRLQQERLAGFLPNKLRELFTSLTDRDNQWQTLLRPQVCELTVMFCDLVGFGRLAEEHATNPLPFWETVQFALNMMTTCILNCEGVVIDFQGDAVLAVWGWPPEPAHTIEQRQQGARQAVRAAINIREGMDSVREYFRERFQGGAAVPADKELDCGVGLTSGVALVGFMGNESFGGLDVFGHTINRASRLQSLTRRFHTPILMDEETHRLLLLDLPPWCTAHQVVSVWLAGMARQVHPTYAVFPTSVPPGQPERGSWPVLNPQIQGAPTAQELSDFTCGNWEALWQALQQGPPVGGFRLFMQEFLRALGRSAPRDWDGVYAQRKEA